ncbi:MAG TPA: Zn-dependent alcohol dehydrogenase [Solirubrobacteraceae bacterium]|nr:Zn-dependent alcohol dehydrogenase [Solirubrobacteraceae bacterium]
MTDTIRAAVLHEFGEPLVIEELTLDPPREGEIRVRMAASGVCHSDLHVVDGIHPTSLPVVLGHEGAGIVEDLGPGVNGLEPGDHVLLTWLPYCGHCRECVRGRPNICENTAWYDATMEDGTCRFHLGEDSVHHYNTSSFAERSVVPARTAIKVDPDLPLSELALMGCAVMTGVGAVLNTARVRPGESVAVVGCGGVGLNVVQGARIAGAERIIAIDVVPAKLELARQLGATDVVDGSQPDVAAAVRELVPPGVDHAFEALGRPETIATTLELTARGGEALLIGMAPPDARVGLDALTMTLEERCVRGSWYGSCVPLRDIPMLVELYREGRLRLEPLITTCRLDDVNEAFARMRAGKTARSVIVY